MTDAAGVPAPPGDAIAAAGVHVLGLHHVGIVVADLDAAVATWTGTFGARVDLRRVLDDQGIEAASLDTPRGAIELITPLAGVASGVARFLERRGEGPHHVALEVPDVAAALVTLARAGVRLVDEVPRNGLHGTPIAFVHPSAANGVLVELVGSH